MKTTKCLMKTTKCLRCSVRQDGGFTLPELLVVMLVVGILAAIAIPVYNQFITNSKHSEAQSAAKTALNAAEVYYSEKETYQGLTNQILSDYDKSLANTSPAGAELTPGDGAAPQKIIIASSTGTFPPGAGGHPDASVIVLCSVSKGDRVFCIRRDRTSGGQTTQYASWKKPSSGSQQFNATALQGLTWGSRW